MKTLTLRTTKQNIETLSKKTPHAKQGGGGGTPCFASFLSLRLFTKHACRAQGLLWGRAAEDFPRSLSVLLLLFHLRERPR